MKFVATVYAYDVMSAVQATVVVREYAADPTEESNVAFECTTTIPGIGEPDARRWLEDILLGVLEEI